ncbi:uncharacterized protein LOC135375463 [Ornithodoros turicata]|uniref:uncharacterized protein LOC135375463 n=1 Tax=Ornithodoros turicata TaxID=34597 RepID=UPI003138ACC5
MQADQWTTTSFLEEATTGTHDEQRSFFSPTSVRLISLVLGIIGTVILLLGIDYMVSRVREPGKAEVILTTTLTNADSYAGNNQDDICSSEPCAYAARNVSLNMSIDPCYDMYGHVCSLWAAQQKQWSRTERTTTNYYNLKAIINAVHQSYLNLSDAYQMLSRIYQRCLNPDKDDAKFLRSMFLDNAGITPWPVPKTNVSNPEDMSKMIGNAFYFTGEHVFLKMVLQEDQLIYLGEPILLRDAPGVDLKMIAAAARMVFATDTPPLDVNQVEAVLANHRKGHVPNWEASVVDLAVLDHNSSAQWRWRTVLEEAFEPNQALRGIILGAPHFLRNLPHIMGQLANHEILNYLGFRIALLGSPLLLSGLQKELTGHLTQTEDLPLPRLQQDYCVRLVEKYEPVMSAYILFHRLRNMSQVFNAAVDNIRSQAESALRPVVPEQGRPYLDLLGKLHWRALMPHWVKVKGNRLTYFSRFYGGLGKWGGALLFGWMEDQIVNSHLSLNDPAKYFDREWKAGFLQQRPVLQHNQIHIPAAAFDWLWAIYPVTAPLQLPLVGVRLYTELLRFIFDEQQRNGISSSCDDSSLEGKALDAAHAAYTTWSRGSLRLVTLENVLPEQLFFVFYILHHCKDDSNSSEQLQRVLGASEAFSKAYKCNPPSALCQINATEGTLVE